MFVLFFSLILSLLKHDNMHLVPANEEQVRTLEPGARFQILQKYFYSLLSQLTDSKILRCPVHISLSHQNYFLAIRILNFLNN